MNRRGFFATLAALCAAPSALLKLPKAKRLGLEAKMGDFAIGRGTLNSFKVEELAANPMHIVEEVDKGPVMVNRKRYFPHECEWRLLPHKDASQCIVCGDVMSGVQRHLAEFDDHELHLAAHRREMEAHFDEFYARKRYAYGVYDPRFVGMDSKTRTRFFLRNKRVMQKRIGKWKQTDPWTWERSAS